MGLVCIFPHLEKSGSFSCFTPRDAIPPLFNTSSLIDFVYNFTSSIEIRPPGPLPFTSLILTPISLENLRTEGAAGAILRPNSLLTGMGFGTGVSVFSTDFGLTATS